MAAFTAQDHQWMALAIQLAEHGLFTTPPNPRVGCVLVKHDSVIAKGWHQRAGAAHAEIIALAQAGEQAKDSTAYVTLEPCAHRGKTGPCVTALIDAGVARVVVAMRDPNPQVNGRGIAQLRAAGIRVDTGLLATQATALNPGFISRMQRHRPYLRLKMAMSLDGRTALDSGDSQWISGANARQDVQYWRARSSAIMTGINTVLQDDPLLTVRTADGSTASAQPLRVILDSQLKIPLNARLFSEPGPILILTTAADPVKHDALTALAEKNIKVVTVSANHQGRPELSAVMSLLAEMQVNELLVEAGHILAGALLTEQLLDELIVYMAPCVLGNTAKGLFALPALSNMQAKIQFGIEDIRPVGADWRIIAKPIADLDHA